MGTRFEPLEALRKENRHAGTLVLALARKTIPDVVSSDGNDTDGARRVKREV